MCGKKTIVCLALSVGLCAVCLAETGGKLEMAGENVYRLIEAGQFAEARARAERIERDFAGDEGLAETQYRIAERFERLDRFDEAKRICRRIIQNNPQSQWGIRARLGKERAQIKELILAQEFEKAKEAIDKLEKDFSGKEETADAIFWIAERFERIDRFEDARQTYRRITQNFADSAYAGNAKFGAAKAEIMSLIVAEDYDQAKKELDKFVHNFEGEPNFPWAFYWITERYDRANKFEEAKAGFEFITSKFPKSGSASGAKLRLAKIAILSLVKKKDYDKADEALDKMIRDFRGHNELGFAVSRIGEEYYGQKDSTGALEKARKVFKITADELPVSWATPEACCWVGDVSNELEQYEEAIEFYKRACDGYPQYAFAAFSGYRQKSLFMIGQCYDKLGKRGDIANEETTSKAIEAYERLLGESGDFPLAKDSWRELGYLYAGRNNREDSIRCFEQYRKIVGDERCPRDVFYELARAYDGMGDVGAAKKNYERFVRAALPNDERRKEVKERLAEIKNTN
ncbi:MAG: tetratricopeptide repeat protein [Sedimentisphaerales bacterium]|nr:tetratricopeptide repeat protein [Sedimentisphaerales bacterium]